MSTQNATRLGGASRIKLRLMWEPSTGPEQAA